MVEVWSRSPWHWRHLTRHWRLPRRRKLLSGLRGPLLSRHGRLLTRHWRLLPRHGRLLPWHGRLLSRHWGLLARHWRLLSRHPHLTWHRYGRSLGHGRLLTHWRPSGSRRTAHLRPLWSWMHLGARRHPTRRDLRPRGSDGRGLRRRGDPVLSRSGARGHTGRPQRAIRGPRGSSRSPGRTLRLHHRGRSLGPGRHPVWPRRAHPRRAESRARLWRGTRRSHRHPNRLRGHPVGSLLRSHLLLRCLERVESGL